MCEASTTKSTGVEFPILSCYIVPSEVRQTLRQLDDNLDVLGYQQSSLAEEATFTGANWVRSGVTEAKLTLFIFSISLTEGSILVEVDTKALEPVLKLGNIKEVG